MKELRVYVGPEFFDQVGESIQADLGNPTLADLGPGALRTWIVEAGDARGRTIADNFRNVRSPSSAVGARYEQTREGVPCPLEETPAAQRVIARVLAGSDGVKKFRHQVSIQGVNEAVPVIARVGRTTGMKFRVGPFGLRNT